LTRPGAAASVDEIDFLASFARFPLEEEFMRRLHGALIAFALAALAAPAAAAEITRVASSGEAKNAFDLDLSVRYERLQQGSTINREGVIDELRYVRTRHAIVPRVAIGLYHDLEIHFEMPYVLADEHSWRFGDVYGKASGGLPGSPSSIESNPYDPDGLTSANGGSCTPGPCPLFAVGAEGTTVYHGGMVGDLKAGLAWGIFNDRKDDTKPSWVVGTDLTFPTAKLYDPAKERLAPDWTSPYTKANPGPFGEKVWKWDVYTALSKRMGIIDPYLKAHFTKMFKSNSTYSNCDEVDRLDAADQVNSQAVANCKTWGDEAGAELPWIAGVTFGTEVVAYEDVVDGQKVAFDFRLFSDYTSPQRFYNELTDATGKIHKTGSYLTMGGLFGLYLQASEYVSLQATASLATRSAHYLTGESLGRDGSTPRYDSTGITVDPTEMNPNFDWRYDAPGRRFRISEVSLFELGVSGVLRF
jgi:hypothetical protein